MISQKIPSFIDCAQSRSFRTLSAFPNTKHIRLKEAGPLMDPGLPASGLQSGSIRISLSLHAHVALCGCLHYCACACKPAPRSMQHPRFLFTSGVIRIPLSLHAHVALSRYVDVCITALVRASPHRAVCNIHAPLVGTRQFCSAFINAGISCFFLETTFGRYATSFSSISVL